MTKEKEPGSLSDDLEESCLLMNTHIDLLT